MKTLKTVASALIVVAIMTNTAMAGQATLKACTFNNNGTCSTNNQSSGIWYINGTQLSQVTTRVTVNLPAGQSHTVCYVSYDNCQEIYGGQQSENLGQFEFMAY